MADAEVIAAAVVVEVTVVAVADVAAAGVEEAVAVVVAVAGMAIAEGAAVVVAAEAEAVIDSYKNSGVLWATKNQLRSKALFRQFARNNVSRKTGQPARGARPSFRQNAETFRPPNGRRSRAPGNVPLRSQQSADHVSPQVSLLSVFFVIPGHPLWFFCTYAVPLSAVRGSATYFPCLGTATLANESANARKAERISSPRMARPCPVTASSGESSARRFTEASACSQFCV